MNYIKKLRFWRTKFEFTKVLDGFLFHKLGVAQLSLSFIDFRKDLNSPKVLIGESLSRLIFRLNSPILEGFLVK